MTPEEMGAALGPGWEWYADVCWLHSEAVAVWNDNVVTVHDAETRCPTPEAAVAVAHLLVAAEQGAAGGDVPRLCGEDCATEREMAYAHGRDEERAAVVAWLRDYHGHGAIASSVERAEHWADHTCADEGAT